MQAHTVINIDEIQQQTAAFEFNKLPDDIKKEIFEYLPIRNLAIMSRVSKSTQELANETKITVAQKHDVTDEKKILWQGTFKDLQAVKARHDQMTDKSTKLTSSINKKKNIERNLDTNLSGSVIDLFEIFYTVGSLVGGVALSTFAFKLSQYMPPVFIAGILLGGSGGYNAIAVIEGERIPRISTIAANFTRFFRQKEEKELVSIDQELQQSKTILDELKK